MSKGPKAANQTHLSYQNSVYMDFNLIPKISQQGNQTIFNTVRALMKIN